MVDNYLSFSKERRLRDLSNAVDSCTLCPRMCHRTKVLSEANGNVNSKILFIAEAPGRLGADRTGIPLFGDKTGDNFEKLLGNISWKRKDIFITNSILCNPRDNNGNNGTPSREELKNCFKYLEMTIELVKPEVIATLGRTALNAINNISPHNYDMRRIVSSPVNWNGIKLVSLYHPAPRALAHRSLIKQSSDFIQLAKFVNPISGIILRKKAKNINDELVVTNFSVTPLQQIIFTIIDYFKQLSYFKLTKLLYFIDLSALDISGNTLTDSIYLRQQEGPWPPDLNKAINALKNYEIEFFYKKQLPFVKVGPSPRFEITLSESYLNLIIDILNKFGSMSNAEIKSSAYRTAPMKYIIKQEKLGRDMRKVPLIYQNKTAVSLDNPIK